jgi:predicted dinucleotide-binding enzyme
MKIGILGSGDVAKTLGGGFARHGHDVMMGSRTPSKLAEWAKGQRVSLGTFADAADFGSIVVLAVKGSAASAVLRMAGAGSLEGKVVIDTTNPIADAPPVNGVLPFFTSLDDSLMERLQKEHPGARFVKAFNSVGNPFMVNPRFEGGRATMFICGNDDAAKGEVTAILDAFGWDAEDMGKVEAARAIEPLCILWCIPGFLRNEWTHAFKLVKPA